MNALDQLADVVPIDTHAAIGTGRTIGRTVTRTLGDTISQTQTFVSDQVGTIAGTISGAATAGVRAATRRLTDEAVDATDDWGRDPVLVRNIMLLAQLRWDVSTGGDQHLPKRKGALIVVNAPQLQLAPIFTAFAISEAVDRPVRFVGRTDDDLVGALARRIGGLLDHPDEIAGALRADELVVLGASPSRGSRSVGRIDHTIVGAALATDARVLPAATSSHPLRRRARVEIGRPQRPPRSRRGPLGELELADRVRREIGDLLEEMGDIGTGTPLDWLPLSGMGGS